MNKADQLVDQAADRLQEFVDHAAAEGGIKAKLAEPLADDVALLRRMKPSLIKARIKGEAPTNLPPSQGTVAPSGPQLDERPKPESTFASAWRSSDYILATFAGWAICRSATSSPPSG